MLEYSEFREFVKGNGLSRQNRYTVELALPVSLVNVSSSTTQRILPLLCRSVSVPGVNVATAPVRYTGEVIEAPYDRTFGDANIVFLVDRQMDLRYLFDNWIHIIQDPGKRTFGYYDDFIAPTISINILDKRETTINYTLTLFEAFPKTIGDLTVDQSNNEMMTLPVTFNYRYYLTKTNPNAVSSPTTTTPSTPWGSGTFPELIPSNLQPSFPENLPAVDALETVNLTKTFIPEI